MTGQSAGDDDIVHDCPSSPCFMHEIASGRVGLASPQSPEQRLALGDHRGSGVGPGEPAGALGQRRPRRAIAQQGGELPADDRDVPRRFAHPRHTGRGSPCRMAARCF